MNTGTLAKAGSSTPRSTAGKTFTGSCFGPLFDTVANRRGYADPSRICILNAAPSTAQITRTRKTVGAFHLGRSSARSSGSDRYKGPLHSDVDLKAMSPPVDVVSHDGGGQNFLSKPSVSIIADQGATLRIEMPQSTQTKLLSSGSKNIKRMQNSLIIASRHRSF